MTRTMPLRRLIASLDNGTWGDDPAEDGTDTTCVRAADFDFKALRVDLLRAPIRSVPAPQRRRLALHSGDLVLEKSGGGEQQPVGRAVLFRSDVPAVCSNFAARLRPRAEVSPDFLVYLLVSLYWSGATARCIKQTTGIQNLDTDEWIQTQVRCPPLDEQRRIAAFLDDQVARIDQTIAMREQQMSIINERIMAAALEGVTAAQVLDRKPSTLTWVNDLPSYWTEVRLSTIAQIGTGHTPSRSEPAYWMDCNIPWLTTGDVHRLRDDSIEVIHATSIQISQVGLENSAAVLHPPGTVALSRTASPGFSAIMGIGMATSQDFVVWRPCERLDPQYLLWVLRAMRKDILGRLATGSTHKTIYFPDLESLRIPLPPRADQLKAVAQIQERMKSINVLRVQLRQAITLLKERKRSLITAAVTGEFDVSTASTRALADVTN